MGSASDAKVMESCVDTLQELKIPHIVKISSAHRTPEQTKEIAESAEEKGIEVIIAGAGMAAHLAGVIAAHTTLPVIGIPIDSSPLNGMDSLLSTVQMPPGMPVATVSIGKSGAKNAAILAAQILALKHPDITKTLKAFRKDITKKALEKADSWNS